MAIQVGNDKDVVVARVAAALRSQSPEVIDGLARRIVDEFYGRERSQHAMKSLLRLLNLPDMLLTFIGQLNNKPSDEATLCALADWLEDANRPKEATRVSRLVPQHGDVWAFFVPPTGTREEAQAFQAVRDRLKMHAASLGRPIFTILLPIQSFLSVQTTDELQDMRRRIDEAIAYMEGAKARRPISALSSPTPATPPDAPP